MSLAPPYTEPALPVSARFAGDSADDVQQGLNAAATGWRDYFADPRLRALIALSLENNRDLRIALLRVEEARALYGIQRADQWPTIVGQAGLDRSRSPADLSPTGSAGVASQYQVALGLATWEIDFWGRLRNLSEAALQSFFATDEARRAATVSLIAQVVQTDLVLRELDERLVLARQTIGSRQESFRIFSRRVAVGSTSRLDLAQVETLLNQAQALGSQLEQARAAQYQALVLLVGAPIELPFAPAALDTAPVLAELRAGLPSDLLQQRPDIVAAEHELRATHANIGAARAAFFPNIALTGSFGTASADLNSLFAAGSHAWLFSPTISLPLFDDQRRRNALSLAEVRRDIAVAHYERTVQEAFRDVATALSARRWLDDQATIAQTALAIQTERARLAGLRYSHGAAAFLEVLDAQRDLLVTQQQSVQARRASLASRVDLYAALGGGSMALSRLSDADATAVRP